jgi:hypothetical protein
VRSTQRLPLRTLRRAFQGRPRPSWRRGGSGMRVSRIDHWKSVRSRVLRRGMRLPPDKWLRHLFQNEAVCYEITGWFVTAHLQKSVDWDYGRRS